MEIKMEKINEKQFDVALKTIGKSAEGLAASIHLAGLFAIEQSILHNNASPAIRLREAMGKKHDAQRVVTWLCFFGKLGVKKNAIVYRARKDVMPEHCEAQLKAADDCPYWDKTPQKAIVFSVDYLAGIKSLIAKHEQAIEKTAQGEEVREKNIALVARLHALVAEYAPKAADVKAELGAPIAPLAGQPA
jgi:hypothetical protein